MKKVLFAFAAMLGSVAFVNAQDASTNAVAPAAPATAQESPAQDEKVKIQAEELPAPVKKALETADFKGWLIDAAYKYSATETYEVSLKNGAETKVVKFDKEGKSIQ